jgi:hypothetical protein
MWIDIEDKKMELLDKICSDLPKHQVDLYELLDGDEYIVPLLKGKISMERYKASVFNFINEEYPNTHYAEIFESIYRDIFDNGAQTFQDFVSKTYELFNSLEDVEYYILEEGSPDYELVEVLLQDELEK